MKCIDRYLSLELVKRLGWVLVVVLGALVLERLLRLFDLVSMKGGPMYMVWEMAAMLVPHYMGLALPAGFFVAIYLVASSCSTYNEFDVLLSGGVSPIRFAAPFIASGIVLTIFAFGLFGYMQPYGRYSYRAVHYLVDAVPWGEDVPERTFATVDKDATVSADHVDAVGSGMAGIFVHMKQGPDDVVITARRGKLMFGPQKIYYRLRLKDGTQLVTKPDGTVSAVKFDELAVQRNFITDVAPFRARGDDVREMTLDELATHKRILSSGNWTDAEAKAELHARLVRSLSLLFLPFFTIPLAISAKRRKRSSGVITGAVVLVLFHYVLQTLQGLAGAGKRPVISLWIALAVFALMAFALFWRTQKYPGSGALDPVFDGLKRALSWLVQPLKRLKRAKS
ncbi:MAG: LptF/LptG family permease [Rhizomicrobium sp.]